MQGQACTRGLWRDASVVTSRLARLPTGFADASAPTSSRRRTITPGGRQKWTVRSEQRDGHRDADGAVGTSRGAESMARLAVWKVDRSKNVEAAGEGIEWSRPQPVERSQIDLERQLEDWIVEDAALIAEDLTIVGRQRTFDRGRLDLLAIDSRDRWVVVELKAGRLGADALTQALSYAASIAQVPADELQADLESRLGDLGSADTRAKALAPLARQLNAERETGEKRKIAVMLVGVGVEPELERVKEFLTEFDVPISVVSFEVFGVDSGAKLLIREVIEEPAETPHERQRLTVEAIRRSAVDAGVAAQFERFVEMSEAAGLAVQPQRASVRIAPPTNRTRFLMYVQPRAGSAGGELGIWVGPRQFAEFFAHVSEEDATDALGRYDDGAYLGGEALDKRLDQIEQFLTENFPPPATQGE